MNKLNESKFSSTKDFYSEDNQYNSEKNRSYYDTNKDNVNIGASNQTFYLQKNNSNSNNQFDDNDVNESSQDQSQFTDGLQPSVHTETRRKKKHHKSGKSSTLSLTLYYL